MKNDLKNDFKFSNVVDLDHGTKFLIENDFQITSYQFNPIFIDSSIVIENHTTTILNSNDSKTFGFTLEQITDNHPNIDFVFRSHSSAAPIPQCIKGVNVEKTDRKPIDYAEEFTAFAKATNSKYAVPFASSHIYLHKLTQEI